MTFHSRSLVEFGLFLSRLPDAIESQASLERAVEMIRVQLGAAEAALRISGRPGNAPEQVVLATGDAAATQETSARLADLVEARRHASATASGDECRCTLMVFRDRSEPDFDAEETALLDIVVEQVRRGVALSQRISANEIERALYSSVMNKLSVGVVVLDLAGHVMNCSTKAEETLSARDGLQIQAGRLRATNASEDRELQAAIKAAILAATGGAAPAARGLALTKLSGNRTLGVIVQPAPDVKPARNGAAPTIAIYIRDPEANADVESDLVRQLFDLTPAEAAVARRLTAGLSLEDAATSLDISRNTARAHLRSIFSKSGITRQTELVRMLLNSAAVLGERPRQFA